MWKKDNKLLFAFSLSNVKSTWNLSKGKHTMSGISFVAFSRFNSKETRNNKYVHGLIAQNLNIYKSFLEMALEMAYTIANDTKSDNFDIWSFWYHWGNSMIGKFQMKIHRDGHKREADFTGDRDQMKCSLYFFSRWRTSLNPLLVNKTF